MQTNPRLMTLTEIAWQLASLKTEGQIDWQAVAKLVQSWLDASRELRMVPGPPPKDANGSFVVQWADSRLDVIDRSMSTAWGNGLLIAHLPWPILSYKPPKPLTEAEAWAMLRQWRGQPGHTVRLDQGAVDDEAAVVLSPGGYKTESRIFWAPVPSQAVVAAAEWIRSQGGSA